MKSRLLLDRQLKALANRRRLDVLAFLKKNHSAYVGEITKEIGISMQALSKHLKQLADANIVTSKKRGLYVTYRLFVPQSSIVRKVLQEL
ncbi:MAG: metalloregulator ArsR/SmtB family transcription factor [Candidatus Peribacteraceae bacterium]|nr:metalloregulator ArsR/SmtB family transcription factor [Candidatus Peribacteraceae bacterium]MDP7645958.1 metalloregulator ArsR/SmtB family transcription factor [Candidatus Peribacteraceae bacterium]